MAICIYPHPKVNFVTEFLEFNGYPYRTVDLWQPDLDRHGRHTIPHALMRQQGHVLVLALDVLADLVSWTPARDRLIKWLQVNHMIAVRDGDSWIPITHGLDPGIRELDRSVPPAHLEIITDGRLLEGHWLRTLHNVKIDNIPTITPLVKIDRIRGARIDKLPTSHDFLLTTVFKASAPHRDLLWRTLCDRPHVLVRGRVITHTDPMDPDAYVGYLDRQTGFSPGTPSMDLYRTAWIELVPETLSDKMHYITEKTTKPMATCTPFLMMSTPGYLRYLRDLGFRTFGDLIDESYDELPAVEDRAARMVAVLEDVIDNGAEAFYRAAWSQLEHNRQRLTEIMGGWYYHMDEFLLEKLGSWIDPSG
jgi:hypothetical protein